MRQHGEKWVGEDIGMRATLEETALGGSWVTKMERGSEGEFYRWHSALTTMPHCPCQSSLHMLFPLVLFIDHHLLKYKCKAKCFCLIGKMNDTGKSLAVWLDLFSLLCYLMTYNRLWNPRSSYHLSNTTQCLLRWTLNLVFKWQPSL